MQIAYGEYTKDVKAAIDLARFQIGESVAANVTDADKAIFERLADRNTAQAERAILAARVSRHTRHRNGCMKSRAGNLAIIGM